MLAEWGLAELAEVAELLVSEITTNALRGSRALGQPLPSPIHLWLRADRLGLVIMVWDANPQPPIRKEAGHDAVSGRGLKIVEALSSRWGWYKPHDMGGKCVWCEIQAESQPMQHSAVSGQPRSSPDSRWLWS